VGLRKVAPNKSTPRRSTLNFRYSVEGQPLFDLQNQNTPVPIRNRIALPPHIQGQLAKLQAQNQADADIRKAMKKLQAASSEEEKNGAKAELSTLFDRYFDADMKRREKNIVDLESRVQKLRAQFDKSQAAKDKILQLQLQVLSNEAEGLGFFSPSDWVSPSPWPHSQQHTGVYSSSNDGPRRELIEMPPEMPPSNDGPSRPSWPSSPTERPTSPPEASSDSADRESRSR